MVQLITARKRSLGKGNIFTGVCLSTRGVYVHRGVSVQGGVSVRGSFSPERVSVWGSLSGRPPYSYVRAVRILLECILVPVNSCVTVNFKSAILVIL